MYECFQMHVPSKVLILSQFIGSLIVVILVAHAGSQHDVPAFSSSPTAMALFQLAAGHLFLTFFILCTALHTNKIYETPLICFHGLLFFVLLTVIGVLTVIESTKFESLRETETGVAGMVAIVTAFISIASCCFSYKICENLTTL